MVFESVVTDVLNRFLADYVENLDSKQLKIGIWGGDIVLKNLILKQSALNDLDLPIQTVYGRLNTLVLKIPWKNLYTASVEAYIDGLYLLVEPNSQVKYNAEKEEKKEIDAKQAELKRLDDAKQKELDKDKPKPDDSFVEKLTTQVIKNVQLTIKNIHVRYEDTVTNPGHPFSMGLTLSNLALQTTDNNWKPTVVGEAVRQIYKIMELEGFSIYWNSNSVHYRNIVQEEMLEKFQADIATRTYSPEYYNYILGPINSTAKLILNPKPQNDSPPFTIPKLHVDLTMEKLAIGITKLQYRDVIKFADSMNLLTAGLPYRKYRPHVSGYTGHAKEWWQFAYTCVLETEVKRRRRNWDWVNMINHRQLCKEYSVAYHTFLQLKKVPTIELQQTLNGIEKRLDIWNIVLIRQRIALEVERLGKLEEQAGNKSWLSKWWAGPSQEDTDLAASTDLMKQFQAAMTPEEKEKLFRAIDYNQQASPTEYPDHYVDSTFNFHLKSLVMDVQDEEAAIPNVINAQLVDVKCKMDKREAMQAIKLNVMINNLNIYGLEQDGFQPVMVTSSVRDGSDLLDVLFETNALDHTCDQRLHIYANPLKVIYDAITINKVVDVFKMPESSSLEQLSAATASGLYNIKEMSAIGLENIINQHPRLDLQVNLHAPFIILPYGGRYTEVENVLVVNLGKFRMTSVPREASVLDIRLMAKKGQANADIIREMKAQSYDKFDLQCSELQVVLAQGGQDWVAAIITSATSVTAGIPDPSEYRPMHLLNPTSIQVVFSKCLIVDDPTLPLSTVTGNLPSLRMHVTDMQLMTLMALINSVPLPGEDVPEAGQLTRTNLGSSTIIKYMEISEQASKKLKAKPSLQNVVQFTQMELNFVMKEMVIQIGRQESMETEPKNILALSICSLECDFMQQTFNSNVALRLGSVNLDQNYNNKIVNVIHTPNKEGEYLLKVFFTQVEKKSPELHTIYNSCECSLGLEFESLHILLNQEALTTLMVFANNIQVQIDEATRSERRLSRIASTSSTLIQKRKLSDSGGNVLKVPTARGRRKSSDVVESIMFKLTADLNEFSVTLDNDVYKITTLTIKGISAEIIQKMSQTQITMKLQDIYVINLNPRTVHKKIICVTSKEAINAKVIIYNNDKTIDSQLIDVSINATIGGLRIVFLNRFVSNVVNFLNNFQEAQAAIIEASQAAAETAKQNMQHAYENATRVSVNISLKAPDIIIPEATYGFNALQIDLGHITITNVFKELDIKNEKGRSAVIDELLLDLTDLMIIRILLDKNDSIKIEKQVTVLEPVSFNFLFRRNLSNSWYRAVPDMEVSATIESISLRLSQPDHKMLMYLLEYNLGDTVKPKAPVRPAAESNLFRRRSSQPASNELIVMKRGPSYHGKTPTTTPVVSQMSIREDRALSSFIMHPEKSHHRVVDNEQAHTHSIIKWSLRMDKFVISLFSTKKNLDPFEFESPRIGITCASLIGLSLTGRILEGGAMYASVMLTNCLIDDIRPHREDYLNRLFERKLDNESTEVVLSGVDGSPNQSLRNMIEVNIHQNGEDILVDLKIYSFMTILSMDFLSKISGFFTPEEIPEKVQPKTVNLPTKSTQRISTISESAVPKETTYTITVKIEKPDIILVEHMDTIETNALILNTEMLVKFRMAGSHQVINGTIKDTTLYTCCFNPVKREATKITVLYPVTMSVGGSTPEGKGLHIDVIFTDIKISVSPTIIELMNRVTTAFAAKIPDNVEDVYDDEDLSNMWNMTPYHENDFWFLKSELVEMAEDAVMHLDRTSEYEILSEMCMLTIPSFVITCEAGVGSKTIPMILVESGLTGRVDNWSSQLHIEASLTLQIGYYNSSLALWEPLVEPVEVKRMNASTYMPWSLEIDLSMYENEDLNATSPMSEVEDSIKPATITIDVQSKKNLELTVTKNCLEVLSNLGKAFSTAMQPTEVTVIEGRSPFKLMNYCGMPVNILLDKGDFALHDGAMHSVAVLANNAEVHLQLKVTQSDTEYDHLKNVLLSTKDKSESYIYVQIKALQCELKLPLMRADKRYFPLKYRGDSIDNWGIVSSVLVEDGITTLTLSSIISVHNHFDVPVDVYYMMATGNELAMIASVQPNDKLHLPLEAVYTPTNEIFLSVNGYSVTTTPFIWKELQLNLAVTKLLNCAPSDRNSSEDPFIIKIVGEIEQIYHKNTTKHTMASTLFNIHLRPAVVLQNSLPIQVILSVLNLDDEQTIEPGELFQIPNIEPGKSHVVLRLPDYLEKQWSCRKDIQATPQQFSVWTFDSHDSVVKMSLDLGMHCLNKNGSTIMSLYCPFWMLNKTGLLISYRKSKKTEKNEAAGSPSKADENLNITHHPPTFNAPILFSFNAKNFFGKKKASIRIGQGEWSDKFSLDVAGSSGAVVCKSNNVIYQIGVSNKLTYNGLTKQVTFTPYFVMINNAPFAIESQELSRPGDPWTRVDPNACTPLWPLQESEDKLIIARVVGTNEVTAPFLITESHTTLLKLLNKYGGINVDIQITEGAVYINLTCYEKGMAPVLIINNTKNTMNLWEKHSVQLRKLPSSNSFLYTWENPSGPRVIVWEGGFKAEYEDDVRKDDVGEYLITETQKIYWVSFLDGMQRVLLFTGNEAVAESAQSAKRFEIVEQEITLSLHGVGLSLVNNDINKEIMYMAIASTGIIWEYSKSASKRYKRMSHRENIALEAAYVHFVHRNSLSTDIVNGHCVVDGKTEVDFIDMVMLRPHKRKIRRTFETGFWVQMKTSPHQMQVHAKINRVQIDNQLFDCIFPVVLAPVPPPKSVGVSGLHKPFAELSIVQLLMKHSQIKQYKYFKILIQEFHIKVDLGFMNAVMAVFDTAGSTDAEELVSFKTDLEMTGQPLYNHVSTQYLQDQKNFYDLLHFSPLKIHVSFSMAAGSSAGASNVGTPNFLNVLLQGLGVTLTDLQDVIFKLAYFEREYNFLSQKQLTTETQSHYVGQLVKQLYVLVFGLDVIGNPYGLVIGISKGVEDLFYEPFQGAIQGPGEFAEGLVLGVRSLFGHTVGGAAGAVSRITGAMGKGIAALTFDKDYQRKRRDQMNKKPATLQEGIARSGKGLVMGVVDGVTGVFTKPVSGAKEQGVEGFFKGLGKGAVGLITRPTAGVVDFASSSLDTVKRVTEVGNEELNRQRPSRFIPPDGLIRPFCFKESEGHKLLAELEKGKYSSTDIYVYHVTVVDRKEVLLLTDKRIAYITYSDLFGGWQIDWSYTWTEMRTAPRIVQKGIFITTDGKRKKMGFFGSAETGKTILISDAAICEEVCQKIEHLQQLA